MSSIFLVLATEIFERRGARQNALPGARQRPQLRLAEMAQEPLADTVEVRCAGLREQRRAALGEHREAAAAVVLAVLGGDRAVAREPVDEPRRAGTREQHRVGE